MNKVKRGRHLWTAKQFSYIIWLAKYGCDPHLISLILTDDQFIKDVTLKGIVQAEGKMQLVWNHLEGNYVKPSSLPQGGTFKTIQQALTLEAPVELDKYKPKGGELIGPRELKFFSKTSSKIKPTKATATIDATSWTAPETSNITSLIKSGYSDASVVETLLNTLRSKRSTEDILTQVSFVRCFLLSKIQGREKEFPTEAYPTGSNLQVIVNSTSVVPNKLLLPFSTQNARILGPSHLIPVIQDVEEGTQQELTFEEPKESVIPLTPISDLTAVLIDAIIGSAKRNGVTELNFSKEGLTLSLKF